MNISESNRIEMLEWSNDRFAKGKFGQFGPKDGLFYAAFLNDSWPIVFNNVRSQIVSENSIIDLKDSVELISHPNSYADIVIWMPEGSYMHDHQDLLRNEDYETLGGAELIRYNVQLSTANGGGIPCYNMNSDDNHKSIDGTEISLQEGEYILCECKNLHQCSVIVGDKPRIYVSYAFIISKPGVNGSLLKKEIVRGA